MSTSDDTAPGFVPPPDDDTCDVWQSDCPEGQKCAPASNGEAPFGSSRCVPVVPEPDGLYEPCEALGTFSDGLDTCGAQTMCLDVELDTKTGTCLGLCTGSADAPVCADPDAICLVASPGMLNVCRPTCDPLLQDCISDHVCLPNLQIADAVCVSDASGEDGQLFDPCDFPNDCDPGLICVGSSSASECDPMANRCCLPFCDTSEVNTCPGQDQVCLGWFPDGVGPPALADLGVCSVPPMP